VFLGVSTSTVRRWKTKRGLPVVDGGGGGSRFQRTQVVPWLWREGIVPASGQSPIVSWPEGPCRRFSLKKRDALGNGIHERLRSLHQDFSGGAELARVEYPAAARQLWGSHLEADDQGGGLWHRTYCTGAVPGDGLDSYITMVVADGLRVEVKWPMDSIGDIEIAIFGESLTVERAIDFLSS
jgi:hypothetical protein